MKFNQNNLNCIKNNVIHFKELYISKIYFLFLENFYIYDRKLDIFKRLYRICISINLSHVLKIFYKNC